MVVVARIVLVAVVVVVVVVVKGVVVVPAAAAAVRLGRKPCSYSVRCNQHVDDNDNQFYQPACACNTQPIHINVEYAHKAASPRDYPTYFFERT